MMQRKLKHKKSLLNIYEIRYKGSLQEAVAHARFS